MNRKRLGVVIVTLALASCSSIPILSGLFIDDAQMNQMGVDAFEEIKQKETIETNAYYNNYVKCVAKNILAVTQDPTGVKEWEIVVFRNNAVNAFALPGGKIGVYTGLLSVAKNQDQLAAVIGHEVGHVIKQHSKARYQTA
ncbi:MAG: M48 family metalloprotease, partial [Leptospiraceae bacterium]|nr:M48 family metalloprotease [Leptospiraceae bacterium]